jgi:hypothetical protein
MGLPRNVPQALAPPTDLNSRVKWTKGMTTEGPRSHTGGVLEYTITEQYPLFVAPKSAA